MNKLDKPIIVKCYPVLKSRSGKNVNLEVIHTFEYQEDYEHFLKLCNTWDEQTQTQSRRERIQ